METWSCLGFAPLSSSRLEVAECRGLLVEVCDLSDLLVLGKEMAHGVQVVHQAGLPCVEGIECGHHLLIFDVQPKEYMIKILGPKFLVATVRSFIEVKAGILFHEVFSTLLKKSLGHLIGLPGHGGLVQNGVYYALAEGLVVPGVSAALLERLSRKTQRPDSARGKLLGSKGCSPSQKVRPWGFCTAWVTSAWLPSHTCPEAQKFLPHFPYTIIEM